MNILVLGAAGKTGREVVAQALAAGHTVTAFARDPRKLERNDVPVAVGDARSVDDLRTALRGQDAVISTLGNGINAKQKLIESSTQALLEAMPSVGVKRLVMLSTFAASPTYKARGVLKLARVAMKAMVADKTAGETLIKGSDTDWTIVYATRLTDEPRNGGYRTVEGTLSSVGTISRADLADALLSTLSDATSVRQSRVVTSR
ncbi:MAG: SDR family oxidoreductase [Candidatus Dormibacteraeota bacterium]|nr:SDR family oxidoreductase [Candidatus Dormibacteraeota bacterium]